jgi:hypothetical protein
MMLGVVVARWIPSTEMMAGLKVAVAPRGMPVGDMVTCPQRPSMIPSESGRMAVPPGCVAMMAAGAGAGRYGEVDQRRPREPVGGRAEEVRVPAVV